MAEINGIHVVEKVKKDDAISGAIWDNKIGLLIPSSYFNYEEVYPILVKIPRDICKEMVKDLMDEIRKEESGHVYD